MKTMLIVDDDKVTRELLSEVFSGVGIRVHVASSAEEALTKLSNHYAVVLSDIRMAELDGLGLLKQIKAHHPTTSVVLMTGFGNLDGAVEAIQLGAFDYVSKPFEITSLKALIARAFEQWDTLNRRGPRAEFTSESPLQSALAQKQLMGRSAKMVEVYKTIARAALSESTVLIYGESGTGKELAARTIHNKSSRKGRTFVAVNCGALTESLLESELFGHTKGAFTGAVGAKRGLFEEAHGGTLFLDEVGELTPALQVKLLRALQEGEIKPVGSSETKIVDVRVIAATHRDLTALIQDGKFREDLYYRFKVITLEMPALRFRKEDLAELVSHFISVFSTKSRRPISHVSDSAMEMLLQYDWPGNVRELQHAIERAVVLARTEILHPEDFALEIPQKSPAITTGLGTGARSLEDLEREHILNILVAVKFNKSKAAEALGIDRATLYRKASRFGISLEAPPAAPSP